MKYLDEYRNGTAAQRYAETLRAVVTRPWTLMEVCGGQTHSIVRYGIDEMLPPGVTLVHGPGCPVCVTPVAILDRAFRIARRPGVVFTSFGDMLRVPGTSDDLLHVRAEGGDVRVVYSPLDAVAIAEREPEREVVFFAVGFETTAPANAMAVQLAARKRLTNFSLLVSQVRVPPALEAILSEPECRVQGFLAAGHVCTVMGTAEYEPLARAPPGAGRGDRLRAAGPAAGGRDGGAAARGGAQPGRDPVLPRRPSRRQPRRPPRDRGGVRGHRPHLARPRPDSRAAGSG